MTDFGSEGQGLLRRRSVLVGATGVAGLLAGCSSGQNPDDKDDDDEEADGPNEQTGTSTESTRTRTEHDSTGTADTTLEGSIPMGSILPISGALRAYGSGMQEAVKLAVEDINDAGGVRGAEIKLIPKDSETKPERAALKYNSLVVDENIVGFVGAASSGVSTAIARFLADDGVMQVSNASTSPVLAKLGYEQRNGEQLKFFGRTAPNDGQQGLIMGRIMNRQIGADTAAVLHDASAYGQGLAEKATEAFDGETTDILAYSRKSQDYTPVLDKLHENDPDAIGLVGYPENGQTILQQWSNGSYGTVAADWVLSEGLNADNFLQNNNDIVGGMWLSSPGQSRQPGAEAFNEKIGDANTLFAAHAYDAMMLQALAMQKAGEASGPAIARNIRSVSRPGGTEVTVGEFETAKAELNDGNPINYQGAAGLVNLTGTLEPVLPYDILRIQDDGSRETIEEIPRSWFKGKL